MARLSRPVNSETGSALVELAVSLPLLVLILVGTADFARVFYTAIELTNAARAGAQYGAYNPANSGDIPGMVAMSLAINSTFAATAARTCLCADDSGGLFGTISCTVPASSCGGGRHRVMTVTVTASKTFSTLSGYLGLGGAVPLVRAATLRVSE
jgi:Flp pilus assembly protein TadG